jgi:hypothetical protein
MNSTEEPENLKQFILGLLSGKNKIKTPAWYWILLAVAFVLLWIVIMVGSVCINLCASCPVDVARLYGLHG